MQYRHARFVIYYKNGITKMEDRSDPNCWDNALKHEFVCQDCGRAYPDLPEVNIEFCLHCATEFNRTIPVIRQSAIIAMAIQFDPLPLYEDGEPVLGKDGRHLRSLSKPYLLKGSSVWDYNWIQDKPGEQRTGVGKKAHGLRIGRVEENGWIECFVGYLAEGTPTIYSYRTTLHSLAIDEPALKLHGIKPEECGKRIVTQRVNEKNEKLHEKIFTDLGERHQVVQ